MENQVIDQIFKHRSVRKFDKNHMIPREHIDLIIKGGQQASTSCTGQMYTVIELEKSFRKDLCGKQQFIQDASYFGIICVDLFRLNKIVKFSGGKQQQWPMAGFAIGVFDAGLFAQNMALVSEALGYDVCFCGTCGDMAENIIETLKLPEMVIPLTGIAIGKGLEDPPVRPRLQSELIHHKNEYKQYSDEELEQSIEFMSEKLESEGYYRKYSKKENYLWRDHMKNKFGGEWLNRVEKERLQALKKQKFL